MRSRFRDRHSTCVTAVPLVVSIVCFFGARGVRAAEITLKNGTVFRGSVESPTLLRGMTEPEVGFVRVDDGLRRILFHTKQMGSVNESPPLAAIRPFRLPQPLQGRNQLSTIDNLVSIVSISQFDDHGRRTFSVRDARGQTDLAQGITDIHPDFVKIQALNYPWESSLATSTIPADMLEKMMRRVVDPKNVDDRLRLARFFIAMEWFVQAGNELKVIAREFPQVADQVREAGGVLEELKVKRRLKEIKLRRDAGQHSLAYQLLKDFPVQDAPVDVLTEVRDLLKLYETQVIERMQQVQREIERLRGEIKDPESLARLSAPLQEITESIHVENLVRLDNFLSQAGNKEISPEDRLAAAISGWICGNAFAEANTDRALKLWEGRAKIWQYLQEPLEARRQRLLAEVRAQEIISVDLAAHVIENLPPLAPAQGLAPDKPTQLKVNASGGRDVDYWVLLPPEYNPYRQYPVIIALHRGGLTPEQQIGWWSSPPGFQASRHGYIVVAPRYVDDPRKGYQYDLASHDAVLYTLIDVRRRFSVDSDRVFLSGHSMGGDAAWDIGLAHPDLFAGVIPICGAPKKFPEHYWPNGEHTSLYVIDGEKNGQGPELNTRVLKHMMENGHDAMYVEFRGRGHEDFSDEILRLFDWMSRKTRRKFPLAFSCRSARPTDNEFFCVSVDDFDPAVMMDPRVYDRKKIKTAEVTGKIVGTANSIQLTLRGAKQAVLWLSPGMLDLDQPVTVRVNGEIKHRKMVTQDLQALLEDFRARADRQKLFYAKVSFPRL